MPSLNTYILFGAIFILVLIIVALLPRRRFELPYYKKRYLMSKSETEFFHLLETLFGAQYYIFPQLHLASVIGVVKGTKDWMSWHNKIDRKSIDFALYRKDDLTIALAIELDDPSHERESRMARDTFVENALKAAELPLVRFKVSESRDRELVRSRVELVLLHPKEEDRRS